VVGETTYTLERWAADSIRHVADERDGIPYLLDYLRELLDLEERRRVVLEAARYDATIIAERIEGQGRAPC